MLRRAIVPAPLRPGDVVAVVAPGFAVDRKSTLAGVRVLESLGLTVRLGESVFDRDGYLAGADEDRARDLEQAIRDDDVRAIHFARGGWGLTRLIHRVSWTCLAENPKLMIGYSDPTALFAPAIDRSRLTCVYGPLVTELSDRRTFDRASLLRAYFRPRSPLVVRIAPEGIVAHGRAEGSAAGGCLTMLAHLAGTAYAPRLAGKVLLIEEVGERPYRIDRMLTQMRLAGLLAGVRAVLVGSLRGCVPRPGGGPSPSALDTITSFFSRPKIPIVAGLRFGHVEGKLSIPLGARVLVDTARRRVVFRP